MERLVYVDNSATTRLDDRVLKEMMPFLEEGYGNASSSYSIGIRSREAVENARKKVAKAINACECEIYFTSGGSEADNMIIKGIARANQEKGKHIITSSIEHLAVLNSCYSLAREGFEITYLPVDENGMISLKELENSIRKDTILISIMFANNEIGTIEPIKEIGKVAKAHNIYFHTDAVQAIGNVDVDVAELNIDALSISAHKFHGPKGVGAAYIKDGVKFFNLIDGGHQECCRRAGTENVAGIVGMGKAIEISTENIEEKSNKVKMIRDYCYRKLLELDNKIKLNGNFENRLPGNLNICFEGIDNKNLLLLLDMNGICVSTGSACNSSVSIPSHVLTAIGCDSKRANSSIRLSFGDTNSFEEVEYIIEVIKNNLEMMKEGK
ncbi:MAG: cysteine desulfurase family protein [Clostridia bacterium]|nr:cysteine desulfurase family protein [Clostridia bacterium]